MANEESNRLMTSFSKIAATGLIGASLGTAGRPLGAIHATLARGIWYRRQSDTLAGTRRGMGRRLMVDVSAIARADARTGIQRVVRGIWIALLERAPDFELVPVVASRRHGYVVAHYGLDGSFEMPSGDAPPVAVRAGDIFLGLDLSAHVLPLHARQVAQWREVGVRIAVVCYDLLPLTHPRFFTRRSRANFGRWIRCVMGTAGTILCISDDVAAQVERLVADAAPARRPAIGKLVLGGNLPGSKPSVGVRRRDRVILARIGGEPVILMVGTVEPRKGYARALDAFERLWRAGFCGHLLIVGKVGWKARALVARLRDHPLGETRLHWIEDASDEFLDQLYGRCSGLLVTSHAEGYCLPVCEAAKHGMPVLARNLSVLREHHYAQQRLFDDDRPAALAETVRSFLATASRVPPSNLVPSWNACGEDLLAQLRQLSRDPAGCPVAEVERHARADGGGVRWRAA